MKFQREPTLKTPNRIKRNWPMDGLDFFTMIGRKTENVEATEAQAKGDSFLGMCTNCQSGDGLFPGCIEVPGEGHCTNCHVSGHFKRCSHLKRDEPYKFITIEVVSRPIGTLDEAIAYKEELED